MQRKSASPISNMSKVPFKFYGTIIITILSMFFVSFFSLQDDHKISLDDLGKRYGMDPARVSHDHVHSITHSPTHRCMRTVTHPARQSRPLPPGCRSADWIFPRCFCHRL